MKISAAIKALEAVKELHGDVEACLVSVPEGEEALRLHESFFIVDEKYDDGWRCIIRTWPY